MRSSAALSTFLYLTVLYSDQMMDRVNSLQCYCSQPHELGLVRPECIGNLTCNSAIGCFQQRVYSARQGKVVDRLECLEHAQEHPSETNSTQSLCAGDYNNKTSVFVCCYSDFCNKDLPSVLPMETEMPKPIADNLTPVQQVTNPVFFTPALVTRVKNSRDKADLVAAITVSLGFVAVVISFFFTLVCVIFYRKKHRFRRRLNHSSLSNGQAAHNNSHSNDIPLSDYSNGVVLTQDGWNHGTNGVQISPTRNAPYLPYLNLSYIGDIVKISYRIENGKFGTFYHGYYDGEAVMLKKFELTDKNAWLRESVLYNQVLPPHDSILVCFASAMVSNGNGIPEHWLITKHHHLGSLQDYLRHHSISPQVLIQMATSICSGLAYLHSDRSYNQIKSPVAHCNLTSRNLLVKGNLFCCIADFRLAVFKHKNRVNMALHPAKGTVRYMAPETLSSTLNLNIFESFKCLDVYALGLILWEICKRTTTNGSKK